MHAFRSHQRFLVHHQGTLLFGGSRNDLIFLSGKNFHHALAHGYSLGFPKPVSGGEGQHPHLTRRDKTAPRSRLKQCQPWRTLRSFRINGSLSLPQCRQCTWKNASIDFCFQQIWRNNNISDVLSPRSSSGLWNVALYCRRNPPPFPHSAPNRK